MWIKEYEDYPLDAPLLKERVESGKGIIGCEMCECNGWNSTYDVDVAPKRQGFWRFWIDFLAWFSNCAPSQEKKNP